MQVFRYTLLLLVSGGISMRHTCKSIRQITLQVINIFQPDLQAQCPSARIPLCDGAVFCAIKRRDQAFKTTPGITHAEDGEAVQQSADIILCKFRIQYHREQAGRTGEVAFPDLVPGQSSKAGCSTRITSGRDSQCAISSARDCASFRRIDRVRNPRSARKQSSAPGSIAIRS